MEEELCEGCENPVGDCVCDEPLECQCPSGPGHCSCPVCLGYAR